MTTLPPSPSDPTPPAGPTPEAPSGGGGDPVADRRAKLAKLRDVFHVDPFGHRVDGLLSLADARARYDKAADDAAKTNPASGGADDKRPVIRCAGRIVLHRDIGKLVFMTLRDATGDLQVGVSKKSVDETAFNLAKLADLGDIVIVSGPLGTTKTGEVTIWATGGVQSPKSKVQGQEPAGGTASETLDIGPGTLNSPSFAIACKSLAPPPEKWHGLTDPELRYRQRYVDLYANPQVARTMQLRMRIVEEIRQFLRGRGYLEVETPMLQPMHGGAAARPFETHHNALNVDLYLRIAPELYLKRLLVGGFHKVFEINRNFRNEGVSNRHNPEFTMLEAYEAFGSWETMADMVEEMICTVAQNVLGTLVIEHKDTEGKVVKTINLTRPWRRVSMVQIVEEATERRGCGWSFDKEKHLQKSHPIFKVLMDDRVNKWVAAVHQDWIARGQKAEFEARREEMKRNFANSPGRIASDEQNLLSLSTAELLVEVYERLVEPTLIDPTFVTHVPSVTIPLARENKDDSFFADVYELAINGVEISPGYTELNDPDVQERHFRHQVGDRAEQQQVDEDFLNALRVGMPPAGGIGLGIDRLVMMLTGAQSIRDVILFPLMKPEKS